MWHVLEILYDNNRLPIQLLLSSEFGPFEDHLQKSLKITKILMKPSILKIHGFGDFWHGSSSNEHISELKRSCLGKRLLVRSISNVCYALSRFLGYLGVSGYDF